MQELRHTNGALLGHVYKEIDGFYVFVPENDGGHWTEYGLIWVAERLKEMNKEWNDYLKENLR